MPKIQNLTSPRNRSGTGPIPRKNALAQVSATSQEDEDDGNLGEDLFVPSKRASKTSTKTSERGRKTASAQPPVASKTVPPWPSSSSETEDQDDEDKDVSYGSHRKPNSSPVKRKKTTTPSRTTPQRTTPSRTPSGRTPSGRTPSRTPQRQTPQRQTPQRTQEVNYIFRFLSVFWSILSILSILSMLCVLLCF